MNIKTKSGFAIEVNPKILEDWILLGYLAHLDECKNFADQRKTLEKAIIRMIGEKGYLKFCKHLEKDGVTSIVDVSEEFKEIITLCSGEAKK